MSLRFFSGRLIAMHETNPSSGAFAAMQAILDWESQVALARCNWAAASEDAWLAACASTEAIAALTQRRFAEIVEFARAQSVLYCDLYRGIPEGAGSPSQLPAVTRKQLMARFDDWVTDREVTKSSVESFMADPHRIGHAYLGRYAVWKSSGTTGDPGLFVHDAAALAMYDALDTTRLGAGGKGLAAALAMMLAGARYAMIAATGGHFAGVSSIERTRLLSPELSDRLRVFSIFEPLPRLVDALNSWQPTYVATHPSVASVLATEQRAGRLRITPAALWLGGETLSAADRSSIAAAFQCTVLEQYGASECLSIACECAHGSMHLNADWVLLEPVDKNYNPVLPGTMSHTVLLTNLANRVQPIIRYDLGDSVQIEPGLCPCGSPFPALLIEGRTDEVIRVNGASGEPIDLLPIALTTVIEEAANGGAFQLLAAGPDTLKLRMRASRENDAAWKIAAGALRAYLDMQGLPNIVIEHDASPVTLNPASGKLQRVLAHRTPEQGD
ncbi:MAG: phenylacetate--CoA ligase family protein [Burkholderiales bacterium]